MVEDKKVKVIKLETSKIEESKIETSKKEELKIKEIKIEVVMIRHGETFSNTLKRYVGTTDESLLESSIAKLKERAYPNIDALYTSPMKRCRQTAQILYPDMPSQIVENFKECDFGDFENKNYEELESNKDYQKWIETLHIKTFPNGDNLEAYEHLVIKAFQQVLDNHKYEEVTIGLVVHGGTIMNIMKFLSKEETTLYDWHVENGCGYYITLHNNKMVKRKKIGN